jgi:nicotinamidase-related amidase
MAMDLVLDAKTTALVLIDLEHGIVAMNTAPHTSAEVVERCAKLADAFRKSGGTVVYVNVLLTEILQLPVDSPMRRGDGPPPPPTASELIPEAGVQPGDIRVTKRQWGAFHGTGLDQQLRRKGIKTIVMGGIATNFGVESTARAGFDQGYEMVFAEDAMTSLSAEMHDFSVKKLFPIMGRVRSSDEIVKALG